MSIIWKPHEWTLGKFILESSKINIDSLIQRLMISKTLEGTTSPSKFQSIIETILKGFDIGEIKLNLINGVYESIDGGHRKRAIKLFFDNKFKLHKSSLYGEVYFKDLPTDVQKKFENYKIRFIIYYNLSNSEMGELFRTTNTVTPVNHMEMLNSYGDLPIANAIRNLVRNSEHNLFTFTLNKKNEENYSFLNFNNNRLKIEETVCRLFCLFFKDTKLTTTSDIECQKMYDKNPSSEDVDTISKKVLDVLDFLLKISTKKKVKFNGTGLAYKEYVLLIRLYIYLKDTYKEFSFKDEDSFYIEFKKVLDTFIGKNPTKTNPFTDDKGTRTESEAMRGYLGDHKNLKKIKQSVKWILDDMDILDHITLKDPKRAFPRELVEQVLTKQNFKDYIDGKELYLDNAVGAHIISHKDGGRTEPSNLRVTSIEHNRRMGVMNLEQYKKLYLDNQHQS